MASLVAAQEDSLIDASELDALLQRVGSAQNDLERLRHLKTAARNYAFECSAAAKLLAPMAQSPAGAVEAAVLLLKRVVDPANAEMAVKALAYEEQRVDARSRLGLPAVEAAAKPAPSRRVGPPPGGAPPYGGGPYGGPPRQQPPGGYPPPGGGGYPPRR